MALAVPQRLNRQLVERLHKSSHLPALDAVRGIAACMVVWAHILGPLKLGNMAVLIFFVLSGFLITWLLIREVETTQTVSIKGFYARRTLRIFPAFYVFWFICVAAALLRHAVVPWAEATSAFFYMGDYYTAMHASHANQIMSITWSLGVEEKFYLIWPTVFVFWRNNLPKLLRVVLGAIAVIWTYRALAFFFFHLPPDYLLYAFDSRFADILVGCALALSLKEGKVEVLLRAADRWKVVPVLLALGIGCLIFAEGHLSAGWSYVCLLAVSSVVVAALLLQMVFLGSLRGQKWLDHPVLRFLGGISYSLYLYHMLAIVSVEYYLPNLHRRYAFPLMVVLAFALATLSYYCIEKPFLQLRKRFEKSKPKAAVPLMAASGVAD